MDINHLVRDANRIHAALREVNNALIATHPCSIYIPEHYMGSELGNIGDEISIVGMFAIVIDNKYFGVSRACALMHIAPSSINTVSINGIKYMEFSFQVNDTVVKNINLIRTGTLVFRIYNEIIAKGKVPWYFDYNDMCFLFDTALLHGNADLRADSSLLELIATSMARQPENKAKFFRHDERLRNPNYSGKPTFIPLQSVAFNATTTISKILGAYFNEGLTSSLVTPTEDISNVEALLRA